MCKCTLRSLPGPVAAVFALMCGRWEVGVALEDTVRHEVIDDQISGPHLELLILRAPSAAGAVGKLSMPGKDF